MDKDRENAIIVDEERKKAVVYNVWGQRTSYYNG